MKKQLRKCVFETNSSAIHSLVVMPEEMLIEWSHKGHYLINKSELPQWHVNKEEFNKLPSVQVVGKDEAIKIIHDLYNSKSDEPEDYFGIYSYDTWYGHDDCEYWRSYCITKHGDKVVALSYYGGEE